MSVRLVTLSTETVFVLETSSDGVLLCDSAGVMSYANPAACRLLRGTNDALVGRSLVPLFAPEWRADVTRLLGAPREHAEELSVDLLTQGGKRLEIALRCEVWPGDESMRALFVRPGAEVTLASWVASSPDAVYRDLLDGLPSAVMEFDPTGVILYANRQIEGLIGYRPEEMIGRSAMDFVAQEGHGRLRQAFGEQDESPRLVQHEYPIMAKDGTYRHVSTYTSPVLRDGRVLCLRTVLGDVTEHKRRESFLRTSEARLAHVFRHLPVMMCALDESGLPSLWNTECERVTGYTAEEVVGNPGFSALLSGDASNLLLALAGPQTPGKELRDFEVELRHKSGQARTVSWCNVSRRVPIEGWSSWCVGIDVTAQKSTSVDLHNYLEFLETLLATIPSPVFYKDTEGRYLGCNTAFADKVLGLSRANVIGKLLTDLSPAISPELASMYADADCRLLASGGIQDYEAPVRFADGVTRDCRLLKSVFLDESGQAAGIVGIMFDLSEKNGLLAEHHRLAVVVEQAPDGVVLTDARGDITYVNPAFEAISGYSIAEVLGKPLGFNRVDERDRELCCESLDPSARRVASRTKSGRLYFAETKIVPVRDGDGRCASYVAVQRDVTQEVELERQILHAQKLEAVGRLAAGIAHEINTPTQYVGDNTRFFQDSFLQILTVLQWYERLERAVRLGEPTTDLLLRLEEAKAKADLEYILDEVPSAVEQSLEGIARVTEIVAAMKEFSHPGSEEKTPFDVNAGIRSTTTVARNEWKYVAELELELSQGMPPVPCHPGDLNQVVLNLVVNAAHAISDRLAAEKSQGKGVIHIATRVVGEFAEIRVTDSGTGIPANIRDRVFEPFFTTKAVGKGTGQGLALAHNVIVDKHQGTISCESEVGVGTTFVIRLPLQSDDAAAG